MSESREEVQSLNKLQDKIAMKKIKKLRGGLRARGLGCRLLNENDREKTTHEGIRRD